MQVNVIKFVVGLKVSDLNFYPDLVSILFQSFLMESGETGEIGTLASITESSSGFEPRSKDLMTTMTLA